jgi:hypothetical protein
MLIRTAPPKLCEYPVRSIEKLRYADTDRNGHISNAVFAVYCQNARMEVLCDPSQVPIPPDTQFAIAKLVLEFREMHWAGIVEIVTPRRGASAILGHARASFVRGRAQCRHRQVRRGADGHDDVSIGAPTGRDRGGVELDGASSVAVGCLPRRPRQFSCANEGRPTDDSTIDVRA